MTHEIKSAIILAAGRGSRLRTVTEKPKALLEVRGEVLIERLIEQLQAKGIDDIIIVTGYRHKDFYYLEDKYDIELVYNKKWFCTNNIVSFIKAYEARSRVLSQCGTIILDADIYINDDSVIQTKIDNSGYYVEYSDDAEKCKSEWIVKMVGASNRHITNVIIDGRCDHGYVLRSLSVWTPLDFRNLYICAKAAIIDGYNMQCYIDHIPCVINSDKFHLRPYIADENSLLEIDTELDYNEVVKEHDNEEIQE